MEKTNEQMELTLASRLNIAIHETRNTHVFMGLLEYKGLASDYNNLINNNLLSMRLFDFLSILFMREISFRWIFLGKGEKAHPYKMRDELQSQLCSLTKENEELKYKLSRLQGGQESNPMKGKVIKMNFK